MTLSKTNRNKTNEYCLEIQNLTEILLVFLFVNNNLGCSQSLSNMSSWLLISWWNKDNLEFWKNLKLRGGVGSLSSSGSTAEVSMQAGRKNTKLLGHFTRIYYVPGTAKYWGENCKQTEDLQKHVEFPVFYIERFNR